MENFNNKDNSNNINPGFSNLRERSNPNNILNLGASNTKGNLNTKSLKENLNEEMKNTESRIKKG